MKASPKAIALIKASEGIRTTAYQDSVGVLTIGYGHTGGVKQGDKVTVEIAESLLIRDVANAENAVNTLKLNITQNQFDALVDFVFNLGSVRLQKSTLLKKIVANPNDPGIEKEFKKWVFGHVDGAAVALPGLVTRRQRESDLYFDKK